MVSNRETNETLLCIAYVFEVANSNCGAQHHIYRLVKDQPQHWVLEKATFDSDAIYDKKNVQPISTPWSSMHYS